MKKCGFTSLLLGLCWMASAQVAWVRSAVCITQNGNTAFRATRSSSGSSQAGLPSLLGVFGTRSATLKLQGGFVQFSSVIGTSPCRAYLEYLVYPTGNRPANPTFTSLSLSQFASCNSGQLPNNLACKPGESLFQQLNEGIDLTQVSPGDYELEFRYRLTIDEGSGCQTQLIDDGITPTSRTRFMITQPLNVTFNQFNGLVDGAKIRLRWITTQDADVQRYVVEKSENGLQFESIDSLAVQPNNLRNTYQTNDDLPFRGTNYYRIKAVNLNGSVKLSPVLRIYNGFVGNTLLVFPNPSGTQLDIWFAGVKKGNYRLSVLLTNGQTIHTERISHDGSDRTWRVSLPQVLPTGICYVFLIDKFQFYKQRFLAR